MIIEAYHLDSKRKRMESGINERYKKKYREIFR